MKKLIKIIGLVLLVIIAFVLVGFIYISSNDIPSYEVVKIAYKANSTPAAVARGKKLANMLCASCHQNPETGKLTGKKMLDAPVEFGDIHSQNITQDNMYGIGAWTDAELMYMLRTGIKRNGQYSPPYMAKLPTMADDDINAIISFLRSDDPQVAANPTPDIPCKPSFLTKMLARVAWKPFPLPTEKIAMPDTTNTLAVGKYLAHNLDCFSCHSVDFKTNDYLNPMLSEGYFGGGNQVLDMQGRVKPTPNLTPDAETGIGNWTKAQFIKAVKSGIVEGQNALTYPMIPYPLLSDSEAEAIYEYLLTIPPIKNKVERASY